MQNSGALYFIRDEIRDEFFDEARQYKVKLTEISPGIFFSPTAERLYWVLDYWPVSRVAVSSISDAAKQLRRLGKRWAYAGGVNFRRGALIAAEVRAVKEKILHFPAEVSHEPFRAFTLESADSLFVSEAPLKGEYAGGKLRFEEDKIGPPSRAYLKLYEALTLAQVLPGADDNVIDLGATPGGWSYVAASLGATVQMIDRSEPDAKLFKKFPRLRFQKGDGLNPPQAMLEAATVIMSDMACEPAKLLPAVTAWLALPKVRLMVCTLKIHGKSDKALIRKFAAMEGSEIYHLWHNGHELTWVWKRA